MEAQAELTRVLVVDNDEEQLRIVKRLLERRGFEVETVASPFAVADAMRAFGPRIVLIDVDMPSLSGPRLLSVVRKYHPERLARLVLFSARDGTDLAALADESRADGWIEKTFDGDELASRLRRLLA